MIESSDHMADVYLKVFTPMTLESSYLTLNLEATKVQTYTEYEVRVRFPIPVSKGCSFEFIFDGDHYKFDDNFQRVKATGAMGSLTLQI